MQKIIKIYPKEKDFIKSHSFYIKKEWDSTLYYTARHLAQSKNTGLNNYSHFMRGTAFYQKKIFKQAQLELLKISSDFVFAPITKYRLGTSLIQQEKYKEAVPVFLAIQKDSTNQYYSYLHKDNLNSLGVCYLHLKKFALSEEYLLKYEEIEEKNKDSFRLFMLYQNLGTLYYEQYKDDKAIPYFEKAYHLAQNIKSFTTKKEAALNMAVVEENRNRLSKAIAYRKEFDQWKDSLNDQNKVWAVAQLEKKFAVKQKQKEVNVLTAENKTRLAERKGLLSSMTLMLLLLIGAAYFYRQKIKQNKIISAQKAILDDLNATKDKLFSIVSHDLRSSVNALKSSNSKLQKNLSTGDYSALHNQLETNSAIANGAYNLLDNLLNWALLQTQQSFFYQESAHLLSLVNQVAYNYEPIMKNKGIAFENKVNSSVFVFVDTDSFKIILRNVLDNAIKFTPENGTVKVYSQPVEDGCVSLVVEDSGTGMPEEKRLELLQPTVLLSKKGKEEGVGTGLGMQLCKSLIERNGGKFDIESVINVGTKMIIQFRLPGVAD
ncbi:ATP-binding protein [Flavobacterium faecale]|uniref:tetratricopeptide repeat-containing sensor histidine kinase n=1 Tax=Flavobacterium faecale TaxID=1355330 RepID=UPI003AAD6BDE